MGWQIRVRGISCDGRRRTDSRGQAWSEGRRSGRPAFPAADEHRMQIPQSTARSHNDRIPMRQNGKRNSPGVRCDNQEEDEDFDGAQSAIQVPKVGQTRRQPDVRWSSRRTDDDSRYTVAAHERYRIRRQRCQKRDSRDCVEPVEHQFTS